MWSGSGPLKGIGEVLQIGYGENFSNGFSFAMLSGNGDLLLKDHYSPGKNLKLGTIANAEDVASLAVRDGRVAVLFRNGEVIVYDATNFDDNGTILPVTVAQDAIHVAYTSGEPTQVLLVTLRDGTVWRTGNYQARWKLDNQVPGIDSIVRTAAYVNSNKFYAKRSDGSWILYDNEAILPYDAPKVDKADVSFSELKPNVGDTLKISIQETYSNGAKIKVTPNASNVKVSMPHLLKLQPDGRLKVLGVGQSEVTVTTGGISKTVTISSSLPNSLTFARQVNGTVFVPAKAVIKAMGGTVSSANGALQATIGDTTFSFKAGDVNAQLNGEPLVLTTAPLADKGETYIPGTLLKAATGARVQWDGKWQTAEISFGGEAKMTVVSVDTAGLVKRAMQGSLANYIGKSYWINHFQQWDRFSKVTVADVVPKESGDFIVQFRTTAGKKLEGYPMSAYYVKELFTNEDNFFNYDPKKKYRWSASTWNLIKAGKISLGMTKDQVRMSWGHAAGSSVAKAGGKTIETWVYYNFDTVSFVNGKVFLILY
ncbi:copper amine oxidase N-terminal domain-containing protein [Cohnella boryungensis]|uniref:Copper amine oxidase N-terminal domain-containing protein n=1 Tax=Cohnella boryungensis TaxID=768479 RepID=A0ABV8SC23_9BACL